MVVAKGWLGVENGEFVLSGYRISVRDDENVMQVDSGDGCPTM